MNFFFWFFLIGFLIASLQDLKRREVDNWLNLLLFFSGMLFILHKTLIYGELSFLINFAFLTFFMLGLAYLFYFGRIFAGGDCKLLFACGPLLVSIGFIGSFLNVLIFCLILLSVGAVYGLIWIIGLFFRDFKNNIYCLIRYLKTYYFLLLIFSISLFIGFIYQEFFFLGLFLLFTVFLFFIGKCVEKNSLVRIIPSKNLREGDWLEKPLLVQGRKIKASFEGLSLEEIKFIKRYKKFVSIKGGIPYAPVFFFAWIVFYFRGIFFELVRSNFLF